MNIHRVRVFDPGGAETRSAAQANQQQVASATPSAAHLPAAPPLINLLIGVEINFSVFSQETKRPSKEMQVTIARQLGLEPTTVGNFFMNARRRSMDKWRDEEPPKEPASPGDSSLQGQMAQLDAGGGMEEEL